MSFRGWKEALLLKCLYAPFFSLVLHSLYSTFFIAISIIHLPSTKRFSLGNCVYTPVVSKCSLEFDTHVSISKFHFLHYICIDKYISVELRCAFMIVCIRVNLSCFISHISYLILVHTMCWFVFSPIFQLHPFRILIALCHWNEHNVFVCVFLRWWYTLRMYTFCHSSYQVYTVK